jgi:hypothetical protein
MEGIKWKLLTMLIFHPQTFSGVILCVRLLKYIII